jgi:hypothetical protein
MMALATSESVAPAFARNLKELAGRGLTGDQPFLSAAISLSAERSAEFWRAVAGHIELAENVKEELLRLHREGKPVPRSFLRAVREAAARLGYEGRPWDVLRDGMVGIEVRANAAIDYATRVWVKVAGERFELEVSEE